MMDFKQIKTAYFIGIGGIGMSAIARYMLSEGIAVYGYDKTRNDFTIQLESEGFHIHYNDHIDHIPEAVKTRQDAIVIYTPAIPKDNKIFKWLNQHQIRLYKRAEVLGIISKNTYTIAVAGTHGKTTTSSMVAHLLNTCNVNFTAFLGGISSNFNSNYIQKRNGKSLFAKDIMVVEADEFDRSFLHLHPDIAIVTSTDADHLDIYGEAIEVKKSFQMFVDQVDPNGYSIINDTLDLHANSKNILYGSSLIADAKLQKVQVKDHQFHFDYSFDSAAVHVVNALPGFHNVENATAAITACLCLHLPLAELIKACASFKGVKRRFEYVVNLPNKVVIDDYAHHPTELKACINSVRELYPNHKITGIFQPHLFSRTRDFVDDFAASLDLLDECWLLDIYPARELPIVGVNSEYLALKMQKNPLLMVKDNVLKHLQQEQPELLLILGAGDIDQLVKPIKDIYEKVH